MQQYAGLISYNQCSEIGFLRFRQQVLKIRDEKRKEKRGIERKNKSEGRKEIAKKQEIVCSHHMRLVLTDYLSN